MQPRLKVKISRVFLVVAKNKREISSVILDVANIRREISRVILDAAKIRGGYRDGVVVRG